MRNQGQRPFIKDWQDAKGRIWLRVVLGPFPDEARALRIGQKLRQQGVIVSYEVRLRDQAWFDTRRYKVTSDQPAQPKKQPVPTMPQTTLSPAPETGAAKSQGSDCYLVVGSYPDRELAQQAAQSWRQQGFKTSLRAWRRGDKGVWHRVLLGPYKGRDQALAAAEQLKQKGLVSSYLLVESIAPPLTRPAGN